MPDPSMSQSETSGEWTFLFELQWWRGERFIQRFHAWDVDGALLWELAWPLFQLQQSYGRLLKAQREVPAHAKS